jgi:hypothetical protein
MNYLQGLCGDWIRQLVLESDGSARLAPTTQNAFTVSDPDYAPIDVATEPGANLWQCVLKMHTGLISAGNNCDVRVYVGNGSEGYVAIVVNTLFHHPSAKWRNMNTTLDSRALFIGPGGVSFKFKAAASAAWTTWTDYTNLDVGQITATGFIAATGNITSGGNVTASGYMSADYYQTPNTTLTAPIRLASAQGNVSRVGATGAIKPASGTAVIYWPFQRPLNSTWGDIVIVLNQATSTPGQFELMRRDADGGAGGAPAVAIDFTVGTGTGTGRKVVTLATSGGEYVSSEDYELVWTPGATADEVEQIQMSWTDRGPRND